MQGKEAYLKYKALADYLAHLRQRAASAASGQLFYSDIYCQLNARVNVAWNDYLELSRQRL